MRFLIIGGTGFIGSNLVKILLSQEHIVVVLSRKPSIKVRMLLTTKVLPIQDLNNLGCNSYFDVIINLSGEPILDKRWSQQRKKILLDSRVAVTKKIVKFVKSLKKKPKCFISASAIGYYGTDDSSNAVDETAPNGSGFAASLCYRWELQANEIKKLGVRTCIIRLPVVLDSHGGIIQSLVVWYGLGLGFIIGNGEQNFSWVHKDDLIAAINFIIENETLSGEYNIVAPECVTNKEFSKSLANQLKKPLFLKIPKFLLKLVLGEAASMLLYGKKVSSNKIISEGFNFKYPRLTAALNNMLPKN